VVHVGFALSIVDEAEAARTWALLEELVAVDRELRLDGEREAP